MATDKTTTAAENWPGQSQLRNSIVFNIIMITISWLLLATLTNTLRNRRQIWIHPIVAQFFVADHSDDALPALFEALWKHLINLPQHQKEAVVDELTDLSQFFSWCLFSIQHLVQTPSYYQTPRVLKESEARTRERPSGTSTNTSTRRDPSHFEYVEGNPSRKRKAPTCDACHHTGHRLSSAACPMFRV